MALMVMNNPNTGEHPSSHLLNSFGTHANTSQDVLNGASHHHQSADTSVAALSQIIAELSQISANQSHFKEGLEKLNDNQQQLHNQNIVTADLFAGLQQDVTQVKTHIKQEVGAAKQYTHSLFNNLKLQLNPQINQIAEWQSKLELQFHQDHNLPTPDPFVSTPHQSKSQQLINTDFMPSNIATPASHKALGNGRPSCNLHSENWLPDFVGGRPQPMPNVDHNVSSHVNEETL